MGDPQQCMERVIGKEEIDRHFPTVLGADLVNLGNGTPTREAPTRTQAHVTRTCAVCLLLVTGEEPCKSLHCGHYFHADCILKWWTHEPRRLLTCPMCRQP